MASYSINIMLVMLVQLVQVQNQVTVLVALINCPEVWRKI